MIGLLKATFTHLVLDLSKGYSPFDLVALEMANHILLVTQLDLPCLRNVVRLMMSFNEMEGIGEKIKIVINRAGLDTGHISVKKAEETIGKEIFWQLPNEYRTMIEARNNGVPLIEQAPKAAITQSIAGLAAALFNETKPEAAEAAEKPAGGLGGALQPLVGQGEVKRPAINWPRVVASRPGSRPFRWHGESSPVFPHRQFDESRALAGVPQRRT